MYRVDEDLEIGEVIVDERILDEDTKSMLEEARAKAIPDFCADMRKIVNNPDFSDVVFLCKDGARVHASRLMLVSRSAVLHSMLLNGMAESELSEIALHEVSSTALLPVMEFLYTGTLHEHAPKDWQNAFEIIGAAQFFLLKGLELIVMDYLLLAAAEVRKDVKVTSKFLSIVVEFVETLGDTVEVVARDLVYTLEWHYYTSLIPGQLEHLQFLTDNAFLLDRQCFPVLP